MPNSNDENDCIANNFGGIGHNYNYCTASTDELFDTEGECDNWGTDCISKNIGGLFKYSSSLVYNPRQGLSEKCDYKLGNKYLQKTGTQCKDVDTGNLVNRYVYINNMDTTNVITGRSSNSGGILPAAVSSVTRIDPVGLLSAITEDSNPDCKKVKVQCHVLNKDNNLYNGSSPYVHIAVDELSDIVKTNNIIEQFSNLNNNNNIIQNINLFKNNKKLEEFYYILLTSIILYLIYKLIHKK
jgi:hypothetical protein